MRCKAILKMRQMFLNICNKPHLQQIPGGGWVNFNARSTFYMTSVNTEVSKWCVCLQEVTHTHKQVEIKQWTPGTNMAVNETKIFLESFLQKRKDRMVCSFIFSKCFSSNSGMWRLTNELGCVSNLTEGQVGHVLVQASKRNLVLLYKNEWQRCKYDYSLIFK